MNLPDYCVTSLIDGEIIDPVLLEIRLEKSSVDYIKSILELEGNPASTNDILLLTTGSFKNINLESPLTETHIEEIWGMHKALHYLLRHYKEPLSEDHLLKYNYFVVIGARKQYAGQLRNTDVTISGTIYRPLQFELLPRMFDNMFKAIDCLEGAQNKAASYLLSLSKNQFFIDGNKRTARLAALHVAIHAGQRFLSFDLDTSAYVKHLKEFDETGDNQSFAAFFECNLFKL